MYTLGANSSLKMWHNVSDVDEGEVKGEKRDGARRRQLFS